MKFCNKCSAIMDRVLTGSTLKFQCRCKETMDGAPDDTLLAEGVIKAAESNAKHKYFVENSSFDTARSIIKHECRNCKLDYMTLISIGENETKILTCKCGARESLKK